MARLTFLLSFLCLIAFLIIVSPVSAHTLKTDGSIGVTLHLDPNDQPVAGQPTKIIAEIADRDNKFTARNCDCRLTIEQDERPITQAALAESGQDEVATVTFPSPGTYAVHITGQPKDGNGFTAFETEQEYGVIGQSATTTATSTQKPTANPLSVYRGWIIAAGLVLLALMLGLPHLRRR